VLDLNTRRISHLPGSEGLWSPRWSPDGRYLAAISGYSEKLMLYDLRTHEQTELAKVEMGNPSWSRNGEFIYSDTLGNDSVFFRVRIRDRRIERIVSLKNVHRTLGSQWTGLAPDGSLLIQRDAGASEIYAFDWDAP
jgi:Tol biopolymer transport system component